MLVKFTNDDTDETPEAGACCGRFGRRRAPPVLPGVVVLLPVEHAAGVPAVLAQLSLPCPPHTHSVARLPPHLPAAAMLAGSGGGGGREVRTLLLPGTHVTPCGVAPSWALPPGTSFGPAAALAQAGSALLAADTHRLADRLLAWLDERSL